jgi:hypothetical protein
MKSPDSGQMRAGQHLNEDLLIGKSIDRPPRDETFKQAPKVEGKQAKKTELGR